jgi:hypothetical protein
MLLRQLELLGLGLVVVHLVL